MSKGNLENRLVILDLTTKLGILVGSQAKFRPINPINLINSLYIAEFYSQRHQNIIPARAMIQPKELRKKVVTNLTGEALFKK